MNRKFLFGLLMAILIPFSLYYLIPIDIYDQHHSLFSFGGATLFAICGIIMIANSSISSKGGLAVFGLLLSFSTIGMALLLFFGHVNKKNNELLLYGRLTKGTITEGESSTTTRRFNTTTVYLIDVTYEDSLRNKYTTETSINGSDFERLYKGAEVDLVYSSKHPGLAKALTSFEELSKHKILANEKISIQHLTAILDKSIQKDSIIGYLNSISLGWSQSDSSQYINERLDLSIMLYKPNEIAFIQKESHNVLDQDDFEISLDKNGFTRKIIGSNETEAVMYYNNHYSITIEQKRVEAQNRESKPYQLSSVYKIFHISSLQNSDSN